MNMSLEEFISNCISENGEVYGREFLPFGKAIRVLLVNHELSLSGAPVALQNMGVSLRRLGMYPIAVSAKDGALRENLCSDGIPVVILPNLRETDLIFRARKLFVLAVVNTADLPSVVASLNGTDTPVIWWIHESKNFYDDTHIKKLPHWLFGNITVAVVGSLAKISLLRHRPLYNVTELLYWIPDIAIDTTNSVYNLPTEAKNKKIFALIASVEERKGQDILLEAIERLPQEIMSNSYFICVGREIDSELFAKIQDMTKKTSNFLYISQISRADMPSFYNSIDCLICASRYDTMPVTVVEACQFSKLVICSENTGTTSLLKQCDAGFVYCNNDSDELLQFITLVATEKNNEFDIMRLNAREVYLNYFTSKVFETRLKSEILPSFGKANLFDTADCYKLGRILYNMERLLQKQSAMLNENLDALRLANYEKEEIQTVLLKRLEDVNEKYENTIETLEAMKRKSGKVLADTRRAYNSEKAELLRQLDDALHLYSNISNSYWWKITAPIRMCFDAIERLYVFRLMKKGLNFLKGKAVFGATKRTQKLTNIKFSIVVPLYNTPEKFLHEMIDSVLAQTYENWELCMADGSNSSFEVERICLEYSIKDDRIKYRKLVRNLGISGNSNACIDMADGDYICLLDHDDILHSSALFEVFREIIQKNADFVYTDEAVFESPNIKKITAKHFKPDFAPDNLRANNYICHFTVFSSKLMEKAGKFRSAFDGSQDHDLILRLTANARNIVHIPKILYYWRAHPNSVADDISHKDYAAVRGADAVRESIQKIGYNAKVESSTVFPAIYRIRYEIKGYPPPR